MILISDKISPNHKEFEYWADLSENLYGGIIKYFNGEDWVYLEEPIFQQSAANRLTQEDVNDLLGMKDATSGVTLALLQQITQLSEIKADLSSVYTKQEADELHTTMNNAVSSALISIGNDYNNKYSILDTKIDNTTTAIRQELGVLQDSILNQNNDAFVQKREGYDLASIAEMQRLALVTNYDDTAVIAAINSLPTKAYVIDYVGSTVEWRINNAVSEVLGSAPEVLDTLEELAAALGNDANFSTTVLDLISTKANLTDVYTKTEVYNKAEVDARMTTIDNTIETVDNKISTIVVPTRVGQLENDANYITQSAIPNVPSWAMLPIKPSYTAAEVGALPNTTVLPTSVSNLIQDIDYQTEDLVQALIDASAVSDTVLSKLNFQETSNIQILTAVPEDDVIINTNALYNVIILSTGFDAVDGNPSIVIQMDADPVLFRKYYIYIINDLYGITNKTIYVGFHEADGDDIYQFDITGLLAVEFEVIKTGTSNYLLMYSDTNIENSTEIM